MTGADDFEGRLHRGLDRLADDVPPLHDAAFDPDRPPMIEALESDAPGVRWRPYAIGAAAVGIAVVGLTVFLSETGAESTASAPVPSSEPGTTTPPSSSIPSPETSAPVGTTETSAIEVIDTAPGSTDPSSASPTVDITAPPAAPGDTTDGTDVTGAGATDEAAVRCTYELYVLVDNDYPGSIAEHFGVTVEALRDANAENPNYGAFVPGTPIIIPYATACSDPGRAPNATDDTLLVLDGTGTSAGRAQVRGWLDSLGADGVRVRDGGATTQVFERSMLLPIGPTSNWTYDVADIAGIGGFDTWASWYWEGDMPADVTAVLIIGTNGP